MGGMAGFDEDDEFSDHNFANFSEDELQNLEEDALRSTQQYQQKPQQPRSRSHLAHELARQDIPPQHAPLSNPIRQNEAVDDLENEYPDATLLLEDEPVDSTLRQNQPIPQPALSETAQREHHRLQRYGSNRPHQALQVPDKTNRSTPHVQAHAQVAQDDLLSGTWDMQLDQQAPKNHELVAAAETNDLRVHVEELLHERNELTSKLDDAESQMQAQRGEISILRSNQAKDIKVLQREQAQLKKSMQDEAEKYQDRLKAVQLEKNQLSSEYNFQSNDLRKVNDEVSQLKRQLKEKVRGDNEWPIAHVTKPLPQNSLRDGFDDTEMMVISPSKSSRSKTTTPRSKRKHNAIVDAPVPPLALRLSGAPPKADDPIPSDVANDKGDRVVSVVKQDPTARLNLEFVQKILDHRPKTGQANLMELFMDYAFPSNSGKTFTSIVLEQIAHLSGPRLPSGVLIVFIQLFEDALKEKYYKCIPLLLEVLNFIVLLDISVLETSTIDKLLPVLQSSTRLNATTRFRHSSMSRTSFGRLAQTPQSELVREADGTACLELTYTMACLISDEDHLIKHFWGLIDQDFILVVLNSCQPVSDSTLMLRLLSTSIRPSTFGNVQTTPEGQVKMQGWIIDRVCYLLWETPRVDEGLEPYDESTICHFRLEVYSLLTNLGIASSPHPHDKLDHHGSALLAQHATAIARIVRSIYDELNAMYFMPSSRGLHAQLVNQGINLLYHIVSEHAESINLQQKLSAVNGVVHKHRVALTRLAFSEGSYLDKDISDETVRMATMMLEESVTPDEAEMLVECFPGYQGRSQASS